MSGLFPLCLRQNFRRGRSVIGVAVVIDGPVGSGRSASASRTLRLSRADVADVISAQLSPAHSNRSGLAGRSNTSSPKPQ